MPGHYTPPDLRDQFKALSARLTELERRTSSAPTPTLLTLGSHFAAVASTIGYPAGYTLERGRVFLRGYVQGDASAVGATITQLPVAPTSPQRFVVQAGASGAQEAAHVRLDITGDLVYTRGPASTFISLDQVTFIPGI